MARLGNFRVKGVAVQGLGWDLGSLRRQLHNGQALAGARGEGRRLCMSGKKGEAGYL